ncbi:hypothetical protein L1987_08410 [Smallanthus sonchifolius]|uniref:Uncharacterized protein n=1 Tax=Smallanthus sonchifolius TaxID=185202 RepID=A0ACB9JKM6_9ASTR|nr:hypothetical protein L1987_08410 [Smallanthus sonchifolius]
MASKRPDRHLENSDRVFVEATSPSVPSLSGGGTPMHGAPLPLDGQIFDHPPDDASAPPRLLGGAPSPLPPLELGGHAVVRSSLKPLHWNKVNRVVEGSLWEEFQTHEQPISAPEIDVAELEELFSNMSPKIACSKEALKRNASISMLEKVQLIDPLRANNTEIMLAEVKLPLHYIVDAVLAMDDTVIDVDQVENLLEFCPTKEETELLKSYTGDQDKLGKCEQYFVELMKVPRMESKLNAFLFKIQFNSKLAEFKKSLNIINSACDEVKKSVKFKEIMKRILYVGNTLNQGTARGAAVGFKLDSLLKLTDTRASNSNATLMHYICKLLATKSPDLLDFHEDFVHAAADV